MKIVEGRVAVVTGAASGIGFCTAALLARKGMKVVLADVNEDMLTESVAKIKDEGHDVIGVPVDVGNFDAVKKLADAAYDAYKAVHLVHLNAGISSGASFFDDETADWRRAIDINLLGVVWGIKAFVNRMIEGDEEGLILATSSGAGAEGTTYNTSAYAATKMAVVSLMECLYGQLRDRESKVTAAIAFPPLADTRLSGDAPGTMKFVEDYLKSTGVPAALVPPEEVADMILEGIENDSFFIRPTPANNESCMKGRHSAEFFEWNERIIRGRAEAQLNDGKPDPYIW